MKLLLTMLVVLAHGVWSAVAQQGPDTLKHALLAPPIGKQTEAHLGATVAVDGVLTVVGAVFDDLGGKDVGAVKVFDTNSGALLRVLSSPTPETREWFGGAVAIAGTRVVVGALGDSAGGNDSGSVFVYNLAGATPNTPVLVLPNPAPAQLDHFGSAVAISNTRVVVGAYNDAAGTIRSGRAFVYELASASPTVPVATLSPASPVAGMYFGSSVAANGRWVAVGASAAGLGDHTGGVVAVYDFEGALPSTPVANLSNPSPQTTQFASAVAISGDRLAVGAPPRSVEGATPAGHIYVYDLAGNPGAGPAVVLSQSTPGVRDFFGSNVAMSGTRVIGGAAFTEFSSCNVQVFDLASATPGVPVRVLGNPIATPYPGFGGAVAIDGARLIVGASDAGIAALQAGAAVVYDLAGATPEVPTMVLSEPGPSADDRFGTRVVLSGTRLLVGVPGDSIEATAAGCVQVFDLAGPTPGTPMLTLRRPSPIAFSSFGAAVAAAGARVVVGAPFEFSAATNATDAGSVCVFDLTSATPAQPVVSLSKASPVAGDAFGTAVAVHGSRVAVGVWRDDLGTADAGSVYFYDLDSTTPTEPVLIVPNPTPAAGDAFGTALALAGDRLVVGAREDDTAGSDAGSVYVYDLASATPTVPVTVLLNPAPAGRDFFGAALALSGSRLVVGADGSEKACVYDLAGASPTVPVLTLTDPAMTDTYFGRAVAVSGTQVVVGAPYDSTTSMNAGRAYVFDLTSATPDQPVVVHENPSPAPEDNFAQAVALIGSTLTIGAPGDDSPQNNKGAVYIFGPLSNDTDNDGLLDLWEYARFGTTTGHGALDDSDGDGREELLELAFDRDPVVPDAMAGPKVVNEGGFLTLTLAKRAGVTYLGQSAATPSDSAFSALTTTVIVNDATTLKVRDNFPINGGGQRFLRVQVTAAP